MSDSPAPRTPRCNRRPAPTTGRRAALPLALALALGAPDAAASSLRDPLAPLPAPALGTAAPLLPVLSATLSGGGLALARLDGEWLSAGERRGGFEVLGIERGRVELGRDGQRLVLQLVDESVP